MKYELFEAMITVTSILALAIVIFNNTASALIIILDNPLFLVQLILSLLIAAFHIFAAKFIGRSYKFSFHIGS